MSPDFAPAHKPEWRLRPLTLRDPGLLTGMRDLPPGPVVLVPDTNVYINDACGNLTLAVKALRDQALLFHRSVCLAEMALRRGQRRPKAQGLGGSAVTTAG